MSSIGYTQQQVLRLRPTRCQWCGCDLVRPVVKGRGKGNNKNEKLATIDHIIRRADGGTHHWSNLKIACKKCNIGRDTYGNCIGAYFCAVAIAGKDASLKTIYRAMNKDKLATKQKVRAEDEMNRNPVPKRATNPLIVQMRGGNAEVVLPVMNIVYQGTQAYVDIFGDQGIAKVRAMVKDGEVNVDAVWLMKIGLVVSPGMREKLINQR